jgi:hypothetical protein
MKRFMAHPLTIPLHFWSSAELGAPRISESLPLSGIRDRLQSGLYGSIYEWVTDIESAIYAFEENSGDIGVPIGQEVRRIFAKERAKMRTTTLSKWSGSVAVLRRRLARLGTDLFAEERPQAPDSLAGLRIHGTTVHDLQLAQNAAEQITSKGEIRTFMKSISMRHPGLVVADGLVREEITNTAVESIGGLLLQRIASSGLQV